MQSDAIPMEYVSPPVDPIPNLANNPAHPRCTVECRPLHRRPVDDELVAVSNAP
jgi:hypothetical protein